MYSRLQMPQYYEGWNEINILSFETEEKTIEKSQVHRGFFEYSILNLKFEQLFTSFGSFYHFAFSKAKDMKQDNPYHSFSVGEHIYYTLEYIKGLEIEYEQNKKVLLFAALFNDLGKVYTKKFRGEYASFFGHENVSAQLAVEILTGLNHDLDFVLKVAKLVQLHMRLYSCETTKAKRKLKAILVVGEYELLKMLNEADRSAK